MGGFVTALTDDVTIAALWGALTPVAAIVGVGILVGFGYTVLKRAIKGIGKGKANI